MSAESIDAMLLEGIPFSTIEDLIEQSALSQSAKNTLWLYAWVSADPEERRRVVREMAQDVC